MPTVRRMSDHAWDSAEHRRMVEDRERIVRWRQWGPYLSERAWGTVREDYSATGDAWSYFPHDHARSRAYRWSEDGMAGFCDREQTLCLSLALWNGQDAILKERAFGLSGPEGNHGEDVKDLYFYEDATPTASYLRYVYKYPQRRFPYAELVQANASRSAEQGEVELEHLGAFADNRYFDVTVEYAKRAPNDVLMVITVENRGPEAATIHVLRTSGFATPGPGERTSRRRRRSSATALPAKARASRICRGIPRAPPTTSWASTSGTSRAKAGSSSPTTRPTTSDSMAPSRARRG